MDKKELIKCWKWSKHFVVSACFTCKHTTDAYH